MPHRLALLATLAFAVALPSPGAAQDPPMCRNGNFPREQPAFGLARITPGERLAFLWDYGGCPDAAARCRQDASVAAGQLVVTGQTHRSYSCAFLPGADGGSAGFLRSDRLAEVRLPRPAPGDWAGRWADGENEVTLAADAAGRLQASGRACWPSCTVSPRERPGGPNIGAFRAQAAPQGNAVAFAEDECEVSATLLPPYLVVSDNGRCGGNNVTFMGVYRRR
jgi:hypothetical protein